MKRLFALILGTVLTVPLFAGCLGGRTVPPEEPDGKGFDYFYCDDETVRSDRFRFELRFSPDYSALTPDILQMAGEMPEEEILSGETLLADGVERPLYRVVMLHDFETGEYITFKQTDCGLASAEDWYRRFVPDLPEDMVLTGEAEPVVLCGLDGLTYSFEQRFEDRLFYNTSFVAVRDGVLLSVNCSGPRIPEASAAFVRAGLTG